jgi:hypothetical protein
MSSNAPKPTLRLDWCTHEAAKYAVEHWHYSRSMPAGKLVRVGVWEGGTFAGSVLFGRGANRNAGSPYGLASTEIAELVRVALRAHSHPVSRIVSIAIRLLRRQSPGLRLIFSYADPIEGHHGGVYQAGGWVYVGFSCPQAAVVIDGQLTHKRSAAAALGSIQGVKFGAVTSKHKYLMPLDDAMRAQVAPLAKPYPKRTSRAGTSTRDGAPVEVGGATPTPALR